MQRTPALQVVKHQHVLSQGLLRFFNTPPGTNAVGIGAANLTYRKIKPRAPRGCGAMEFWTTRFTGEAEDLWGRTEKDLPATINAVIGKSVFQSAAAVESLKAVAALHHARSYNTRRLVQKSSDLAVQEGFENCIRDPSKRKFLSDHSTSQLGVAAPVNSDLKAAFIDIARASGQYDPADNFRKMAADFFVELTEFLGRCHVEILVAPRGRTFVLGDTPVVAEGAPPIGTSRIHYIPPLLDSEEIYFPVHPRFCLRFPAASSGYVEAKGRAVDRINQRQIEQAYREVYLLSDPKTQQFVLEKARGWRAWPELGALIIQ